MKKVLSFVLALTILMTINIVAPIQVFVEADYYDETLDDTLDDRLDDDYFGDDLDTIPGDPGFDDYFGNDWDTIPGDPDFDDDIFDDTDEDKADNDSDAYVTNGTCGENLTWTLDDEGTLTISGTGAMTDWGSYSDTPWYDVQDDINAIIIKDGVTNIGDFAFEYCESLERIIIPDSVISIGDSAFFSCDNLTSVTIGNGVTSIGDFAFKYCESLESVIIPDSVISIGESTFCSCDNLANVTIGNGVTSIGEGAFEDCDSLESITIPDSVTSIGDYAFYSCGGLTNIAIEKSLETIGESAFGDCPCLREISVDKENRYFSSLNGVLFNKEETNLIQYPISKEGTTYIVPSSVIEISHFAFEGCRNLTNVCIGNNVEKIGFWAFTSCYSMEDISVEKNNSYFSSVDGVLFDKEKRVLIQYPINKDEAEYTIPDSVTNIEYSAFESCYSLTSVTIPNSVTSIGSYAFYNCNSLESVTIPDSVTSIGNSTFENCYSLTSVTIPNSVTSIGSYAFYNCDSLESVTIPDSLTNIENSAFEGCENLTSIIIPDGIICIEDSAFEDCNRLESITIPDSVTSIGDSAFEGCSSLMDLTIGDGVTIIGDDAFYGCKNLISVDIGNGVKELDSFQFTNNINLKSVKLGTGITDIESFVFYGCIGLTSITIPDCVTRIGSSAFEDCISLESIIIPDSVKDIDDSAFEYCIGLESIIIPDGVTSIGSYVFYYCNSLESVIIGSSVTSIGKNAFYGCESLESIAIPDSVTSIGDGAFYGCSNLVEINWNAKRVEDFSQNNRVFSNAGGSSNGMKVTFGDNVERIPAYCFNTYLDLAGYSPNVKNVIIGNSVTSIGESAFRSCDSLTSVKIPDSVTSIGNGAFSGCSGLKSITIGNGVMSIGDFAFAYCDSVMSITIPCNVINIGDSAFRKCTRLAEINWNAKCVEDFSSSSQVFAHAGEDTNGIKVVFGDSTERIPAYCFYPDASSYRPRITRVTIGNSVTSIGDFAFASCDEITSITIPNSVTSVGNGAFVECVSLAEIKWNAKSVEKCNAFRDIGTSSNGIKVVFGDNVEIIPDSVLSSIDSLTSVTIGNSVTNIGEAAFARCDSLTSVTIGNSVTNIGEAAFASCDSLTSVIIPDSVTDIGGSAFEDCVGLTSVTIGNSVTNIGEAAFARCDSLHSVTIGNSVTSIGDYMFAYCDNLTNIAIPNSITSIGEAAFASCDSLHSVTIGNSVTSIGDYAFNYCKRLNRVIIPVSVISIGDFAFEYCDRLIEVYYGGSSLSDWRRIDIGLLNTDLTNAEIHYNYKAETEDDKDDEIDIWVPNATRIIEAEIYGGSYIVYDTDQKTYSCDKFVLRSSFENLEQIDDGRRTDDNAYNVRVEMTLPDGFSFKEDVVEKTIVYTFDEIDSVEKASPIVYLKNPKMGSSSMNIQISGDNVETKNIIYDFLVDSYTFQVDIYRADYVITEHKKTMEDTYICSDITPSRELYRAGQKNGLDDTITAWNTLMDTLNTVDKPSSIIDYAFEEKDMYSAIIMDVLESSVNYEVMETIDNEIVREVRENVGFITSTLSESYNIFIGDADFVKGLTEQQKMEYEQLIKSSYKEEMKVASKAGDITKIVNYGVNYGKDLETICETIATYNNVRDLSDSMKWILQEMYNKCPNDNSALKAALRDCIAVIKSGDAAFAIGMAAYSVGVAGKDAAQFGVNKLWGGIKASFKIAHPAASYFQVAYSAGKYISNTIFGADDIAEKYCKIIAMVDVDDLLRDVYYETKNAYIADSTEENARRYNAIVDVMFELREADCECSLEYIKSIDSSLAGSIAAILGYTNGAKLAERITSIENSTYAYHESILTGWIFELEEDKPPKYEEYKHLLDESHKRVKKRYNINCPVDVYVFDKKGVIVASVIDNVPYCRNDVDITLAVEGDRKTIYMYGDEYDIVYEGNDTGTMDITVTEYSEADTTTRNVYFNNLNLTNGLKYTSYEPGVALEENKYVIVNAEKENIEPDYDTQMGSSETFLVSIARGYFANTASVTEALHQGEHVQIVAYVPDGYVFAGWSSDASDDIFDNPNDTVTTVYMPGYDVQITANVIEAPKLVINKVSKNKVEVEITSYEYADDGVVVLVAYDLDGAVNNVVTADSKGSIIFNNLNLPEGKIEVMMWKSIESMIPILDKVEAEVSEDMLDENAYEIVKCINKYRKDAGLDEVVLDLDVTKVSQSYSEDLAANDYLSTTGKDGSTIQSRLENAGISFEIADENIAKGRFTPEVIAGAWMKSDEHKARILNAEFTKIGVGIAETDDNSIVWVVDFIR